METNEYKEFTYKVVNQAYNYSKIRVDHVDINGSVSKIAYFSLDDMFRHKKEIMDNEKREGLLYFVAFPSKNGAYLITENQNTVIDAFRCSLGKMDWELKKSEDGGKYYNIYINEFDSYKDAFEYMYNFKFN